MLKIKTDSNNQIDIENKSIEVSDRVSADGAVTISAKTPTEIKIIKATAAKAIITDDGEIPISTEDVKSVRKVVGILRAPFINSVKQNGGNSGAGTETSDEFTYERTPGTISKLFVHVGESTYDYNTCSDLENMFRDNPKTLQEVCDGKVVLPLPIYALYKNNGDVEAAENYLMPILKKSPADSYYSDESSEGSQFVIVDGDGIERPDLIGEMKNSYLSESTIGKKNFLDQIFYAFKYPEVAFKHPEITNSSVYKWPLKLVKENLVKSVVVDANLTMDNTCADIINVIKSEKEKLGITDDVSDGSEFSTDSSACHAYVLSSDLLFTNNKWHTNEITNDSRTFAKFWAEESSDAYADSPDSRPSASDNWKGVYVIQKAIEEGRALDIFVEKKRVTD